MTTNLLQDLYPWSPENAPRPPEVSLTSPQAVLLPSLAVEACATEPMTDFPEYRAPDLGFAVRISLESGHLIASVVGLPTLLGRAVKVRLVGATPDRRLNVMVKLDSDNGVTCSGKERIATTETVRTEVGHDFTLDALLLAR